MKLKDTFMSNVEISMYFKKFSFALQTIFSLHNLDADNIFRQLQLANNFFLTKNIGGFLVVDGNMVLELEPFLSCP